MQILNISIIAESCIRCCCHQTLRPPAFLSGVRSHYEKMWLWKCKNIILLLLLDISTWMSLSGHKFNKSQTEFIILPPSVAFLWYPSPIPNSISEEWQSPLSDSNQELGICQNSFPSTFYQHLTRTGNKHWVFYFSLSLISCPFLFIHFALTQ